MFLISVQKNAYNIIQAPMHSVLTDICISIYILLAFSERKLIQLLVHSKTTVHVKHQGYQGIKHTPDFRRQMKEVIL